MTASCPTNCRNHPLVRAGIRIADASHSFCGIAGKDVPCEGWGGTIFWKYNADFLKATANKEHG
jgi:hypothetical protein